VNRRLRQRGNRRVDHVPSGQHGPGRPALRLRSGMARPILPLAQAGIRVRHGCPAASMDRGRRRSCGISWANRATWWGSRFHLASHVVHQRRVGGEYLVGRKGRVSHLTQVPIAPASPEILATQPRFHRLRALPVAGGAPGGRRQRRRGSERRQGHPQQAAPRMSGTPLRRRAARRERSAAVPPQTDSRRPPRPHRTPASGRSGTGRPSVRACRLRRHQRMAPCRVASCNRPNAAIRSSLAVANIGL
jgi:hypothetical protein